ncbi:MAG: glycosyltransferase [Candidatus Caenarcaniphilales bacterium]|nr:glycosyltransferase [Candidatus Caenarcaniphilales bacterium]
MSKHKKILFLSNSKGYGGADKSLEELIRVAVNDFAACVVAENQEHCRKIEEIFETYKESSSVFRMKPSNSPINILFNVLTLKKLIKSFKPDLILANSNRAATYLSLTKLISRLNNAKIFLFIRGFDWKFTNFILNTLKDSIKLVPTKAVIEKENYVSSNYNLNGFRVLNNPVRLPEKIEKQPLDEADFNQNVDTNEENSNYILCLANTSRWKGLDYLIKAYSKLPDDIRSKVKLKIYGSIFPNQMDHFNELMEIVDSESLTEQVDFCPFESNTTGIYEKCLFLVNSSISDFGGPETFGRTIAEAWTFKKPVISFSCGGPKYLIDDGVDGFLVDEKNIDSLNVRMKELIENDEMRVRMGEAGCKKVIEKFAPEKIYKDFLEIVEETLSGNKI